MWIEILHVPHPNLLYHIFCHPAGFTPFLFTTSFSSFVLPKCVAHPFSTSKSISSSLSSKACCLLWCSWASDSTMVFGRKVELLDLSTAKVSGKLLGLEIKWESLLGWESCLAGSRASRSRPLLPWPSSIPCCCCLLATFLRLINIAGLVKSKSTIRRSISHWLLTITLLKVVLYPASPQLQENIEKRIVTFRYFSWF